MTDQTAPTPQEVVIISAGIECIDTGVPAWNRVLQNAATLLRSLSTALQKSERERAAAIASWDEERQRAEREGARVVEAAVRKTELAALKHDAERLEHVAGKWCVNLRCARCYGADTWQKSEVTRLSAALQKAEAELLFLRECKDGSEIRAENMECKRERAAYGDMMTSKLGHAEAALEDAERYRWLRDCSITEQRKIFGRWTGGEPNILCGDELDAAIDAAKRSETQRETPS